MPEQVNYAGGTFLSQQVAERAISQKQSIGKKRLLPMRVKLIEEAKKEKIHIFNVGPWAQMVNTGSTGTFTIPACPWDVNYVELLVPNAITGAMEPPISAIMEEFVIKSEDEMSALQEDGWDFAQSMLGIGRGQNSQYALTRFGIFASRNAKPTPAELSKAHAELEKECQRLVKWAADTYATDRKLFSRAVRPEVHFVAAKVLGRDNPTDSPWMDQANPVGRIQCRMCGRICDPDIAKCLCGTIINQEVYLELMAAEEQLQAAIQTKKGK